MATLPSEIIAEILSRLAAKTLLLFKCVCKSWYFLIKTPNFIKLHLKQTLVSNSDRHLLISSEHSSSLHSADLDPHDHISYSELSHPFKHRYAIKLIGSCNGVVCISDESKNDIVLYNPLTKSRRKIPVNQTPNPNNNVMVLGFGYDSKNDDYKVLRLVDDSYGSEASLYSLNNNSWKSFERLPYFLCYRELSGSLVNEALHFMVTKELESPFKFIASFNLQTESFSLIECPKDDNILRSDLMLFLAELGGCLCLVVNIHVRNLADLTPEMVAFMNVQQFVDRVDLWVMKEYGKKESWIRLLSITNPKCLGAYIEIKPVLYSKDGRKILLEIDGVRLGWYDLKSNKFGRCTVSGRPDGVVETVYFIGSLVSFEDKPRLERGASPKKNKKKDNMDNFLSKGFKLRL